MKINLSELNLTLRTLDGVREYAEGENVSLDKDNDRLVIEARNEGGYNGTSVDLLDVLKAIGIEVE